MTEDRPGTIRITDKRHFTFAQARDEISQIERGSINTWNGELSDPAARAIADMYGTDESLLRSLSNGEAVDWSELLEEISEVARSKMSANNGSWPRSLEMLSTWVMNHG